MANPEHVEIVKRGVEAVRRWSEKNAGDQLDLQGADLRGAELSWADLTLTDLAHADLTGAFLFETRLMGCDLAGADLSDVKCGYSVFANVDLTGTKGLDSVHHYGPSTLGLDVLLRTTTGVPSVFISGCGVPRELADAVTRWAGAAGRLPSCFISYAEPDDAFSEQLYNDLQAKGVRCWRWREDAKWGKAIWPSIAREIGGHDKVILICSRDSLVSPRVLREVEWALQREEESGSEVLFPIMIDDYVLKGWEHHRKADVTAKFIGDFRNWQDPESYNKALNRLIRDLRAGEGSAESK